MREHFERSGAFLFRWRSYFPIALIPIVALGMRNFHYPRNQRELELVWELFCFVIGLFGLAARSIAVGYAAPHTSGRVRSKQEADALNMSGMYSIVRHPLYFGNYLMWISVALLPRNVWVFLIVTLCFWLFYERVMSVEEAFLRQKFGAVFESWAEKTPAFWPAFRRWISPEVPLDKWRIANNEKSSILGLVVMFAIFNIAANRIVKNQWELHMFWAVLLPLTLLYYGVLRVRKEIDKRRG